MAKTNPDRTVENAARAAGADVSVMWIIPGPPHTQVACIECLIINKGMVLVETFRDGGWNAFTSRLGNDRDQAVADVLNQCGVPAPDKRPNWRVMVDGTQAGNYVGADIDEAIANAQKAGHAGKRWSAIQIGGGDAPQA